MRQNRWIVLITSFIINLCLGSAYAWSVFQKPLIAKFGWSTGQVSIAFTLSLILLPLSMIGAGKIQDVKGPKIVTLVGGLIFSIGIFLTGFVNSLPMLYLTYGILGGCGIGTAYACTVANTVKWFPDKRGLAGGLTAGGFGFGAVVFAPVAVSLIIKYDVMATFKIFGIVYLISITLCSLFLKAPEKNWKPVGWESSAKDVSVKSDIDMNAEEMMKTSTFYILWVMYAIGCVSGLMIIGHASPIGQEKIGLTPHVAAVAVSFIGLANTFGRIFWGSISDKIGRYNTLVLMFATSGGMLILLNFSTNFGMFVIAICGVALSFGGFLGIFPSITADNFGSKNLGINYGIMLTAFGLAAFIGPRIAVVAKQTSGGEYGKAFIIASVLNIIGVLFVILVKWKPKKQKIVNAS